MSILDILPRTRQEEFAALPAELPPAPEYDLPPYGKPDVQFMPRDLRSGHVAALAVKRYGAEVVLGDDATAKEAGYLTPSLLALASDLEAKGQKASAAFDVHRDVHQITVPNDNIVEGSRTLAHQHFTLPADEADRAQARFETVAAHESLRGEDATLTLLALSHLAAAPREDGVSRFDIATAQHMLEGVDHESTVVRV
jgi:hypothetical protein